MTGLPGWMTQADWTAAREATLAQPDPGVPATPVRYRDIRFRSALEAGWASTLDRLGIDWQYEQHEARLPSGTWYVPDFWLPAIRTFIEVKGWLGRGQEKPAELAREAGPEIVVLMGWPAAGRSSTPYKWEKYLQWSDPLGYDTRLACCPSCGAYQWIRARLSRQCRVCHAACAGLLAKPGEILFSPVEPDRPDWMGG